MEWYDPGHVLGGPLGPFRWETEIYMRRWFPQVGNIIAISSLLESYFQAKACRVLRVPPLIDADDEKWKAVPSLVSMDESIHLVFAGSAGRKDLLENAIRGLRALGGDGRRIRLALVGPTRESVAKSLGRDAGLLDEFRDQIEFRGRLPHRETLDVVKQADFFFLLRPEARFANAGFPTKLVEGLACGVPMIGNLTSDIGSYVRDGEDAIVVPDWSAEAFALGLRRAIGLSVGQRREMKENARRRAAMSFDYRKWTQPLGDFLREVIDKGSCLETKR